MPEQKRELIGEILVKHKVATEADIMEALEDQKIVVKRIGEILIGKDIATQKDILNAITVQLKREALERAAEPSKISFVDRLRTARIPIRIKLSILITFIIVAIMTVSSYFHFSSQRDTFTKQMTRLGYTIVSNLSHNSSVPILENDEASLNILLEDVSKIEDIAYVIILDKKGTIMAHSDVNKADKPYEPLSNAKLIEKAGDLDIQKFKEGGRDLLDFSMPVKFNKITVGYIHAGISLEPLQKKISRARLFIIMLTVLLILIGIGVSFYLSTELSKPLSNLVKGTVEIKKGNFLHRIEPFSNDELGDLTSAFNDMSDGLRKKEIIQDAFGRYVTPEIVDMILQSPDEKWLKGKKIDITVMFADIRGFTAFSEKTEPEEVVNVLNDHFTLATEVILRHGGHVDKFIGDEILAVFGALVHSEDHASKAVTAAVALQKELNDFNLTMEGAGRTPVRIGIGINSGSAIAGNIGSNKRMEYTVIGDAVNLASRLTRVAGPDEIIISDYVYEKTSKIITAEKLEPVAVKGKREPVQIYKVTGINPLNA